MRGDRLRQFRELRGFSQDDLALRTGISKKDIWRYETGKSSPGSNSLTALAQVLEVSADYLLGLVDDPSALLTEQDLSPMERKLLTAVRSGLIYEALEVVTVLTKRQDQSGIVPSKPAING